MRDWCLPTPRFGYNERFQGQATQPQRHLDLNKRQQAALEFLKNQRITNRGYRDLFPDVSKETIRRDLADLVEEGILL